MTTSPNRRGRKPRVRKSFAADAAHSGLRAQGRRTRDAIIKAARTLLHERGSLEFTLRAIALRADISISNLQYYFPTRLAVLRAVFEPVIKAYMRDLRHAINKETDPRDLLCLLLGRALDDAKDVESSALWCHFLSLIAIDPESSQLLEEWYEMLSQEISLLVCAVNPVLTRAEAMRIATLLIAMADGVCVRIGIGTRNRDTMLALDSTFRATVDNLLDGHVFRS